MIDKDQIRVLEFNARLGDPEAQPLLMRVKSDLVDLMEAVIAETLHEQTLEIDPRPAACIVMASKGYPGSYKKGFPISGLDQAALTKETVVFHAGTVKEKRGVVTNGGRVLGVTALGDTIEEALAQGYGAVSKIKWKGAFYRKDIGQKAIKKMSVTPPQVGIVMGSDSDLPVMNETVAILNKFGIAYEMTVASAHRTPKKAADFAEKAKDRGMKVIIAGAGHAAHLAGFMAANTTLPVIGVPIDSSALSGMDALLSTVQMPPGIPVATVAIGKPGATNAGILAAQIIGLSDAEVGRLLVLYKEEMAKKVEEKAAKIEGLSN
jgi:phosphoribosylamine--glycine ligase